MQPGFRVYYGDGSVYGTPCDEIDIVECTTAFDLPVLDVQAIAFPDVRKSPYATGRMVVHSLDFYLLEEDEWIGVNSLVDLVDHILHCPVEKVLKGRMIPNERFESIISRAMKDPGFPVKSTQRPNREDGRRAGQGSN